jgi:histidinol dehydrogenase
VGSLAAADLIAMLQRTPGTDSEVRNAAVEIISQVRADGDKALFELASRFDGVALESLEVSRAARRKALDDLEPELRRSMERSATNITAVHRAFLPESSRALPQPGIEIVRRPDPIQRVGVYAPGGRAPYPSSVLMGAIPARVAGVGDVILCSPPERDGMPSPVVLAAAELAGVDRVFSIGGAGAIAAMALGTASVPRVDKIVGPGNAYVAAAKLLLTGAVAIDSPAGPSELLVIADESSTPRVVATELLAQAEHDPMACVVAICVGDDAADRVAECIATLLPTLPRREIAASALRQNGAVLSAASMKQAIDFANSYAAEHLLIAVSEPRAGEIACEVRNAGSVFVGECSSVAFGDYMTGANHVLPTGGLAKSYSGLSTADFIRWTTIQTIDRSAAAGLARDTAVFANSEGLAGHATAARRWEEA